MQRLRVKFSRGEDLKFLSHLDLIRLWERAFRRASFDLAYSEGFTPHARISLAAPLQVGVTAQAELMDLWLAGWISPHTFMDSAQSQLPAALKLLDIEIVSLDSPSLQSLVRFAEYTVEVESEKNVEQVKAAIDYLLRTDSYPWHHTRDREERRYDLRKLIDNIWLMSLQGLAFRLGMKLRCDTGGSGRPEQVVKALGFSGQPLSIERVGLIF